MNLLDKRCALVKYAYKTMMENNQFYLLNFVFSLMSEYDVDRIAQKLMNDDNNPLKHDEEFLRLKEDLENTYYG